MMYYKVSNIATVEDLEKVFNVPMQHANVYEPSPCVDGMKESNLIVRTMEQPNVLSLSIWGLLPNGYKDQWKTFQNIHNTLNLDADSLVNDPCYQQPLKKRRCIILITGFFTMEVRNGRVYPLYNHLGSDKPFCLAGVYNVVDDGFITCTIIVSSKIQNQYNLDNYGCQFPLVFNKSKAEEWLDPNLELDEIKELILEPSRFIFDSYPISSDFLNDSRYFREDILQPKNKNGAIHSPEEESY